MRPEVIRFPAPTDVTTESGARRLAPALAALAAGRVIAFPTETLYGLAVDPRSPAAVTRLRAAKGRDPHQGFPLIAADRVQVERQLGSLGAIGARLADRFWPGPLTLVIVSRGPVAEACGEGGRLAVRVSSHPMGRALAERLGHPVTATSANERGEQPPASPDQMSPAILAAVDVVVDAGRLPGGAPSTIVDVTGASATLLRAGAVSWERVLESLT